MYSDGVPMHLLPKLERVRVAEARLRAGRPEAVAAAERWWMTFPEDERFEVELDVIEAETSLLLVKLFAFEARAHPGTILERR